MKKTKFMSALVLTAMVVSTAAVPVYAANTATVGTEVTYTANSAAPDAADWLVSYPKKVVLSDFNISVNDGAALKFKLLDKMTSNDYSGERTVTVTVPGYTVGGMAMNTTGTGGEVKMAIADSQKADLAAPDFTIGSMKKHNTGTENESAGYAYLKLPQTGQAKAEGTYSTTVNFTFTDDTP